MVWLPSAALATPTLTITAAPGAGPYPVNSISLNVTALDQTDPTLWVVSLQGKAGEKFPLLAYSHGFLGGGTDLLAYGELFAQMASWGFIVAAPASCNMGCTDASKGAHWTACAGVLDVKPPVGSVLRGAVQDNFFRPQSNNRCVQQR